MHKTRAQLPLTINWLPVMDAYFTDTSDPATTVTFGASGEYLLTLTAGDTEFTVTVTIVVSEAEVNAPPVVDAGPDAEVRVGHAVSLAGSVEDDGLALPFTVSWTPVHNVEFADLSNRTTSAIFYGARRIWVKGFTGSDRKRHDFW